MQFLIHLLWIFQVRLPNRVVEVSLRKMSHQNKEDQSKVTRLREKSDYHNKVTSKTSQIWPHEGIIKIVITHILGWEFVGWAHSHVYVVSTRHNNAVQSSNNNPDFCFNFVCYRHQLAGVELKNFQPLHITPPASHLWDSKHQKIIWFFGFVFNSEYNFFSLEILLKVSCNF